MDFQPVTRLVRTIGCTAAKESSLLRGEPRGHAISQFEAFAIALNTGCEQSAVRVSRYALKEGDMRS